MLTAQFVADNTIASHVICYLEDGQYSHVDLVLPSGALLGARGKGGVQVRPANYMHFTRVARVSISVPDPISAYTFAHAQIGKPYAKGAILDMFLHRWRPFTPNQKAWFCDEMIFSIFMAGGLSNLSRDNPLTLTPQAAFDILATYGAVS